MPLNIIIIGAGPAGLSLAGFIRHFQHESLSQSKLDSQNHDLYHNVTILERSSLDFDANDYGFSIVSNAYGLLVKAGIDPERLNMVIMTHLWQRDAQNREIFTMDFDTRAKFGGAPSILTRRANLQRELLRFATDEEQFGGKPAKVVTNAKANQIDVEAGKVWTEDGTVYEADLIVGADGINSIVRTAVVDSNSGANGTTTATPSKGRTNDLVAFMTQLPLSALTSNLNGASSDEEKTDGHHPLEYLSDPVKKAGGLVNWFSPRGESDKSRLLAYHISPTELQVVAYAPEREFSGLFDDPSDNSTHHHHDRQNQNQATTKPGGSKNILHEIDTSRVLSEFETDFSPDILNLFCLSSSIAAAASSSSSAVTGEEGGGGEGRKPATKADGKISAWRIRDQPPLNRWHARNNRAVVIGDAAHAVTPHAGQGCNISIEDAEALAFLLRDLSFPSSQVNSISLEENLGEKLTLFMTLRRDRTQRIARFSRQMGGLLTEGEIEEMKRNGVEMITREEHSQSTYGYNGVQGALKDLGLGLGVEVGAVAG